jgi:uncharacterized protein YdhG (YjbR/CyaY superfamily)
MRGMRPAASVSEYIARYPRPVQARLRRMRATIKKAAPGATERISYGIPTYARHRSLVHFGAFEHHISFFPTSSGIRAFRRELASYAGAKGTVRFPHDGPIPYGLLARITRFRAREDAEVAAPKKAKRKK